MVRRRRRRRISTNIKRARRSLTTYSNATPIGPNDLWIYNLGHFHRVAYKRRPLDERLIQGQGIIENSGITQSRVSDAGSIDEPRCLINDATNTPTLTKSAIKIIKVN